MNRSYNMNIDTGEKTWLTPPYIIDALGPFDLDPCCPPKMPWQTAAEMVCRPADGLAVDWRGKRVWLNPPYGREAVRPIVNNCRAILDAFEAESKEANETKKEDSK